MYRRMRIGIGGLLTVGLAVAGSSVAPAQETALSGAWTLNAPEGDWVSMGLPADGSYGIEEGVIYGYPAVCRGGRYEIVKGIDVSDFSRGRMQATLKELHEERDSIRGLLG